MSRFQRAAVRTMDALPFLVKPAHVAWAGVLKAKYALVSQAVRRFGYLPKSLSDRGQDRWVFEEVFPGKTDGFFVELGAADGLSESNTYVLEKRYGWNGLCIEPNPVLFDKLVNLHQRGCRCVAEAVDGEPSEVEFVLSGQQSGIVADEADHSAERRGERIAEARGEGRVLRLRSKTLDQVLDENVAPRVIEYLSLDVEGLETRILRHFPFEKYTFLAMTVERPTPELNEILFRNGYQFVRNSLYDSFYVHESVPSFERLAREPFVQIPPKPF